MFTGIIERKGRITAIKCDAKGSRLSVSHDAWDRTEPVGTSLAVNGVCLTAAKPDLSEFECDVLDETLKRTSFHRLQPGDTVNLERPLAAGDRFGGHIVSGHVDGTGTLVEQKIIGNDRIYTFQCGPEILRGIVLKGSIACDGVSLTVSDIKNDSFSVNLIATTLTGTNMGGLSIGDIINVETDVIGKYVLKYIHPHEHLSIVSIDTLRNSGFIDGS